MDHDRRDDRTLATRRATGILPVAVSPSERKQTTKVMYAGVARTHIIGSSIGRLTLDRVPPSHVEGWLVELHRKGFAEPTIRSAYTILRAVLDTAFRDGALGSNPPAVIRRPRVTAT
jgi:site-specific recombinase XerC